jgi:hypothetical protein
MSMATVRPSNGSGVTTRFDANKRVFEHLPLNGLVTNDNADLALYHG